MSIRLRFHVHSMCSFCNRKENGKKTPNHKSRKKDISTRFRLVLINLFFVPAQKPLHGSWVELFKTFLSIGLTRLIVVDETNSVWKRWNMFGEIVFKLSVSLFHSLREYRTVVYWWKDKQEICQWLYNEKGKIQTRKKGHLFSLSFD